MSDGPSHLAGVGRRELERSFESLNVRYQDALIQLAAVRRERDKLHEVGIRLAREHAASQAEVERLRGAAKTMLRCFPSNQIITGTPQYDAHRQLRAALSPPERANRISPVTGEYHDEPMGADPLVDEAERIAAEFHRAYEDLATNYGYETRKESAVPWEYVPEQNKALMRATVTRLLEMGFIGARPPERATE